VAGRTRAQSHHQTLVNAAALTIMSRITNPRYASPAHSPTTRAAAMKRVWCIGNRNAWI